MTPVGWFCAVALVVLVAAAVGLAWSLVRGAGYDE